MKYIKEKRAAWIDKKIELNPSVGTDVVIDHNYIENVLIVSFSLKTLKLFVIIITFSFFFAMMFKMVLEIERDLFDGVEAGPGEIKYDLNDINSDDPCPDSAIGYFTICF